MFRASISTEASRKQSKPPYALPKAWGCLRLAQKRSADRIPQCLVLGGKADIGQRAGMATGWAR
jgi:hypothetical protein